MKERIDYRMRKWILQQLSFKSESTQLSRLKSIDWDVLVVLDACRADALQRIADWPVESAISPASCTPEWVEAVATEGIFDRTHIVSGNPKYEQVDPPIEDATIEPYWESHWNTQLQTTLPETILDRVDGLLDESPPDIVAHLQQPHWPYVAKLGSHWMLAYDDCGPWDVGTDTIDSLQVAMQRGLIDTKKAKKAYEASISSVWNTVIQYLYQWIDQDYTVIVTADHGEMFGRLRELGIYEHPCNCHLRSLVTVPWIEFSPSGEIQTPDDVEDRLRALGYAE